MMNRNVIVAALAAMALIGSLPPAHAGSGVNQKLRAMLPERIRAAGEIKVGTDPQQPPYDFYDKDNKTIIGLEQDLAHAMAERLGVKFTFFPAQFASIIPGVQAGRFDMGIAAFGDFVPREKVVDEIDYTYEATGIIVPAGNPHQITKISDACGLNAAAVQGSIPLQLLDKQKGLCPPDKPMNVMQFPTNDQMSLGVRSGRADVFMDTYGVAAYTLEHQPPTSARKLELVKSARYAVGYQAMVTPKSDPQLRDAIQATLQSMIDDGAYHKIFEKWGVTANQVPKITVNDAARYANYMKLD